MARPAPRPGAGPPRPWRRAMREALYGPDGFYRRTGAAAHFRTSPSASGLFAGALHRLAVEVDLALGCPDPFDVVDVGAGDGTLLAELAGRVPDRWRLTAVELRAGPAPGLRWRRRVPRCTGLLVANEWLDTVPCEVVQDTPAGRRLVLEDGSLGGPPPPADRRWLDREWPMPAGGRAEVGRSRDSAWVAAVARLRRGVAVAIDYSHDRSARPPFGTFTAYRAGRQVEPVADGSCDLTAHVALDACARAVHAAERPGGQEVATLLTTQRAALRALGLPTGRAVLAGDARAQLAALAAAGEAAELVDPGGLGAFGWLVHAVGMPLPPSLLPPLETRRPAAGETAGSAPAGALLG